MLSAGKGEEPEKIFISYENSLRFFFVFNGHPLSSCIQSDPLREHAVDSSLKRRLGASADLFF